MSLRLSLPRFGSLGGVVLAVVGLAAMAGVWGTAAEPAPQKPAAKRRDHRRVDYYVTPDGQEKPVENTADWALRRKEILVGLQQVMGELPAREKFPPLDVRVEETTEGDGFVRHKLTYASYGEDRVPAYLFLPTGRAGKAPAAICLHQTTQHAKDEVAGIAGLPNLKYGLELAQRGYVVLAPDYPSLGKYRYDFNADDLPSGSLKGVINHLRGVDLLAGRDEVDPQRIVAIGHSLGGHNAIFLGVFDERVRAVVTSCGWTPFHDYYGGEIKGWSGERYMPRLATDYALDPNSVPFDFYELVAAIAPRGFFSNSPVRDDNFDVAGVKKTLPEAAKIYRLYQAEERLQARYPDCGHDFPPETREEAYAFLDQLLRHQPKR